MAGSIIKVYNTKQNAIIGGTTGQVTVATDAQWTGHGGAVFNGSSSVPFFIFKEYFYRIETNMFCTGIYIDWNDGEDNSQERANLELITLEKPSNYAITSHIYTQHGSFFPLIKAISLDGYHSKWYTNDANPGYQALEDLTFQTGTSTVAAGINNHSIVREEKAASDKIPHFLPANRPPVAVLKADRKRVYDGIDNDLISGTLPLLYAYTEATGTLPTVTLEASGDETKQVREYVNLEIQTTSTLSGISIPNDTVPKGNTYTVGINEVTVVTLDTNDTKDTVPSTTHANAYSIPAGNAFFNLHEADNDDKFTISASHVAINQVTKITVNTNTLSDYTGGYITLPSVNTPADAGTKTHYWWFDETVGQSASVPAAIAGQMLKEKINIYHASPTPNTIAAAIAAEINDGLDYVPVSATLESDQFTAVAVGAVVTVTTNPAGAVANTTAITGVSGGCISISIAAGDGAVVGENAGATPSDGTTTQLVATIISGDTKENIAIAMAAVIEADTDFNAVAVGAAITITHRVAGEVTTGAANGSTAIPGSPTFVSNGSGDSVEGTDSKGEVNKVHKLYKAKLDNITTLLDTDRVYIMSHDFDGTTGDEIPATDTDKCIAVLSNGNPIVELNDAYTVAILDASESYTRASNLNIQNYFYDFDKQTVTGNLHNTVNDFAVGRTTNTADDAAGGTLRLMTSLLGIDGPLSIKSLHYGNTDRVSQSYTFDTLGHPIDSNSRFKKLYRLPRLQIEDNSLNTVADSVAATSGGHTLYGAEAGDIQRYSLLTNWDSGSADRDSGETVFLTLAKAASFTKDAIITQTTSGATGKVLKSTKNTKFVELYDIGSAAFTTTGGHSLASSNPHDYDKDDYGDHTLIPSAIDVGDLRILKEDITSGRALLMTANASGRTNHVQARTNSTATTAEELGGIAGVMEVELDVSDGSVFAQNDYIAFGTNAEIVKVSSISTNTLTITRGEFGTNPQTHVTSSIIYKINANYLGNANFDNDSFLLGGDSTYEFSTSTNVTDFPENFLICVLPEKWDKLYFRMANTLINTATEPEVNIIAYYTKKTVASDVATYSWEPLSIIDETDNLYKSGIIKWDMPEDWASVIEQDLEWEPIDNNDGSANDPESTWAKDGYGIIIAITMKTPTVDTDAHEQVKLCNVWPVTDEHVELITIEDSHHVSLNSIAVTSSVSYNRSGKYMVVEDRLGKADIRRIGAQGGSVNFSGTDLGSGSGGRDSIISYQKEGTPVFLDVEHRDEDKTRFFGVITDVSEDIPTGKGIPKFNITMRVSHIIEMNSSGVMQTDKISLGGVIDNVTKYVL